MSWLMRVPDAAAIPTVVGATAVYYGPATSNTITLPTGWAAGDLFVVYSLNLGNNSFTTVPAGWTLYKTYLLNSANRMSVHYKTAGSGESNPTISFSGNAYRVVILAAYRAATTPVIRSDASLYDGTDPYATASITTTQPSLIALTTHAYRSTGTAGDPGDVSINNGDLDYDVFETGSSARGCLTHFDGTTPGTFGPYNLSYPTALGNGARSYLFEIR